MKPFLLVYTLFTLGFAGATSADLTPADVAAPYIRSIVAETQTLHPQALLLGGDPDASLSGFQRNNMNGRAVFSNVPVTGQLFTKAICIDTDNKPQEWMTHIQSFTSENIHKGDLLYVTAMVRAMKDLTGQAPRYLKDRILGLRLRALSDKAGYAASGREVTSRQINISQHLGNGNLLVENLNNVGKIKVDQIQVVVEANLVYSVSA
jgi:hypothetical protein